MSAPRPTFAGPVPFTTFIGRDADLARLAASFAGAARLVTLFGPAGIGKTRLALRYAETHGSAATYFCELASAATLEDVCRTVARCMNVPLQPGGGAEELVDQVVQALTGEAALLVVIDNCEQVASHVEALLSRWGRVAPATRFLATSRELLGASGEVAFEVGPLALPRDGADTEAEAVRLFVDRARLIRGDYTLGAGEASSVAALVRELDGLPLAIELAAGWSDMFSAEALLARLPRRLDDLSNRARTVVDRQRTLRTAIDGSWTLLHPSEQAALAQCAVFQGSFFLESAEAVLDLSAWPDAPPIPQVIASLRAKSLVRAFQPDELASSHRRFALYESIRVYAEEKLEASGQRALAEARHTSHFAAVVAAALDLRVTNVTERDQALLLDLENLLAVHARALAASPPTLDVAISIALVLERPLGKRGLYRSVSALLDLVVRDERVASLDPESVALARVAWARAKHGDPLASRAEVDEALEHARQAGSLLAEGRALGVLAWRGFWQSAGAAVPVAEQALEVLCRAGDASNAAEMRILLSYAVRLLGHFERALEYAEQGLATGESVRDVNVQAQALVATSSLLLAQGDLGRALTAANRAEGLARQTGNAETQGMAAIVVAQALQEEGEFAEARVHYERARDVFIARSQQDRAVGRLLGYMGTLEHEQGNWEKADECYREGLVRVRRFGYRPCEALFESALGALEAARDRPDEATRRLDAVERKLGEQDGAEFTALVRLHRGHVDLAGAREREKAGDAEGAAALRLLARERLAPVEAEHADEDVRFARRLLERAIVGDEEHAKARSLPVVRPLVVDVEARWLVLPSGERHAVRQKPTRHLLLALARQHVARPGAPLSSAELIRHGWPNDKVQPAAANVRLRVALSQLRVLGLRSLLTHTDEGYALRPDVPVVMDTAPPSKG